MHLLTYYIDGLHNTCKSTIMSLQVTNNKIHCKNFKKPHLGWMAFNPLWKKNICKRLIRISHHLFDRSIPYVHFTLFLEWKKDSGRTPHHHDKNVPSRLEEHVPCSLDRLENIKLFSSIKLYLVVIRVDDGSSSSYSRNSLSSKTDGFKMPRQS